MTQTTEIPTETMRRAAKLIRKRAEAATPGLLDALVLADLLDEVAEEASLGLEWTGIYAAALDVACEVLGEPTFYDAP